MRAVGPRLRVVLFIIFGLVAVLGANSVYLSSITFLEWVKGITYENYFYQIMFLVHLVLGLLLVIPVIIFGVAHIRNARHRPNRRAVRMGYILFGTALLVLVTGIALMRFGYFAIRDPRIRSPILWAHIITPLLAVWLYIMHRLAGPRIKWRLGIGWSSAVLVLVGIMVLLNSEDPRKWNVVGPKEGVKYFYPSLARTGSGNFIPAKVLMLNKYCMQCHKDTYNDWFHSAHHYSSFNNPPYLFSVRETRAMALKRDGNVHAARWCAGCHDPVPFFSGKFDNPHYDDVHDPTAHAGITCVVCHSITNINSTKGNADYTITQPILYPFTFSKNPILRYINRALIYANPEFHIKTFLKPLHKTSEFCSTCHKVHLPYALDKYKKFLRGQDHYDSYLLSGVSGHGARSFYYPKVADTSCQECHMPLQPSHDDFGAKYNQPGAAKQILTIHDHMFPGADTGIAAIKHDNVLLKADTAELKGCARIDIFGLRDGGTVSAPLVAPLRPRIPTLRPGHTYMLEVVIRTLTVGHAFTQGTSDSNEDWVEARITSNGKLFGASGDLGPHGQVDPWAYFLNTYMLDRYGHRIDRRNVQDIFTPLYNHQIPPGAGHVVHFTFTVPKDQRAPLTVRVALCYRKFDAIYMNYVYGKDYKAGKPLTVTNKLPVVIIATDKITLPVAGGPPLAAPNPPSPIVPWQRWNDYGIGLLLEGNAGASKGELIQAANAFHHVEKLGRPDGPINLARVYYKEGRLDAASAALQRAARFHPPPNRWTLAWLNGLVEEESGELNQAIANYYSIIYDRYPELVRRHFDFSKDYVVLDQLGQALVERAEAEHNSPARRRAFLEDAVRQFKHVLRIDSENVTAHYNLALIYSDLGEPKLANEHQLLYQIYRMDDNAADRAIAIARSENPAANHAAHAIVIYSLQRPGGSEFSQTP